MIYLPRPCSPNRRHSQVLRLAWLLFIVLNCSHTDTLQYSNSAWQEPPFPSHALYNHPYLHKHQYHMDEYDLHLTSRNTIPTVLGLEAQVPRRTPTLDSLITHLVSTMGLVFWGLHTYVVLHMCTSPSFNLQCICLFAGPQRVLSVHSNYTLVSLGLPLQITKRDLQSISLSASSCQKCATFILIMLAGGLQLFLMGTGLRAPTMHMQQKIKVVSTE